MVALILKLVILMRERMISVATFAKTRVLLILALLIFLRETKKSFKKLLPPLDPCLWPLMPHTNLSNSIAKVV